VSRIAGTARQALILPCRRVLLSALLAFGLLAAPPARSQAAAGATEDPNLKMSNAVLTVSRGDYSISGLATHTPEGKSFKHGIALFPGYPGIMRLREDDGKPRFDLGGNFLVRSRLHWLDGETLMLTVDAPSDEWARFSQRFRETPRYGEDIKALLQEAGRRFGISEWTLVGTSEGSISAFHAARMNPQLAPRVILTASVFIAGRNGPGLSGIGTEDMPARLLWVHHESDPCAYTPYRSAREFAERTRSPLLTVRGGGPERGAPCMPFSAHGFVGIERETVRAMRDWIRTDTVPSDVGRE
jgi:pimeloyl-ACP methyl ester carboxylesterase